MIVLLCLDNMFEESSAQKDSMVDIRQMKKYEWALYSYGDSDTHAEETTKINIGSY